MEMDVNELRTFCLCARERGGDSRGYFSYREGYILMSTRKDDVLQGFSFLLIKKDIKGSFLRKHCMDIG